MFSTIKKCLTAMLILALSGTAYSQQSTSLDDLLKESSDLLQQNEINAAIDLLESGQNDYVESIEIQNNLAIAYLGAERYDEALALMQSLAEQNRELNIINHNLAELESSNGGADPVDPIIFVERAPQDEPDNMMEVAAVSVETSTPTSSIAEPAANTDLLGDASSPTKSDIRQMVEAWAAAWSSKDFDNYLSFYADEFEPRSGSYAEWQAFRLDMVTKPGPIHLQLENFDISIYSYEIRARFDQHYVSDDYSDDIRKLLVIDTRDGFWKIVRETTLEVY